MKRVARAADVGARQAWLWRHRTLSDKDVVGDRPRVLVDVSAIIKHDAQTGIQRVVRAVWSDLSRRDQEDFQVVPVHATNTRGYCYASPNFLVDGRAELPATPVSVRPGDRFLGLDLSAHLLPKYRRQLKAWRAHGASIHLVVYDLLPLMRPDWLTAQPPPTFVGGLRWSLKKPIRRSAFRTKLHTIFASNSRDRGSPGSQNRADCEWEPT